MIPGKNPQHCQSCGELMPNAVMRFTKDAEGVERPGGYFCVDCYGEGRCPQGANTDHGSAADRQYHGGQFHRGEW
jgi:hypothetical protein